MSFVGTECAILSRVPAHLIECYRGGGPPLNAPRRLDVFLSLLRRLESSSSLDLRLFSANLLRSVRLDGIEEAANVVETDFVLPFRASAFQFHKYKLLMDVFIPSQDLLNVDESLSMVEKCLLHKMMSSTVQPWERGDENVQCPLSIQQRQSMTQRNRRAYSRCPIEDGVIQTQWGTISPGTVVAAIAASLESQRVLVTDILTANIYKEEVSQQLMESALEEWTKRNEKYREDDEGKEEETFNDVDVQSSGADISNIWVATLAGDLAEVVVNQGPRVGAVSQQLVVGSNNRWNDTLLPRDSYLLIRNSSAVEWHFTDAEILAGIDGLILAKYVPTWVAQRGTLRLSQVIEMYYSNEGVSFEPSVRACNRLALFLENVDTSQLYIEASRFAHILALRQITVYIPVEEMQRITQAAVSTFVNYVPSLLRQNHRECQVTRSLPVVDLLVATDGAWKGYDVEQFMSWIGGALEVDARRSTISLLHGNTGRWIVPPSSNLTAFFQHLHNTTIEWPNSLNLPNIISAVIRHSRNQTLRDIEEMASAGHSTLVLIMSPSDRPSTTELDRARDLMTSLRNSFFDVYFAYAAQELSDFQNINEYLDYSEIFLRLTSTAVSDAIHVVDTYIGNRDVPMRIFGPQCPVNGTVYEQVPYEDYILPGREQNYRIHPFYLRLQPLITVQFRNDGQGRILVCKWRGAEESHGCQTVTERDTYTFNLTAPCPSPDFCPPVHFVVTALSTLNLCAHKDCRLPAQVGYYIRHTGTRCIPLLGSAATKKNIWKVHLGLSLVTSLLYHYLIK
ncbi:uncharacterized protein [Epargyreus clarus]|uniref:uncharacterized protein n=1 Tax=Epargyreus clarus TaxID=520877 RepID=UPI003C2C3538